MSFAEKYLKLGQTYTEMVEDFIQNASVTALGSYPLDPHESIKQTIYNYKSRCDYSDCELYYLAVYTDDGEEYAVFDLESDSSTYSLNMDYNEAFTAYVKKIYTNELGEDIPLNEILQLTADSCESLENVLAAFFIALLDDIKAQSIRAYNDLKKEYPNEPFYPPMFNIGVDDVTYYESSKCW